MFQKVHFSSDIVDKLKHNLRHEGLEARALKDLKRVSLSAADPTIRRDAAWELAVWYADRETPRDAKLGLRYLKRARRGEAGIRNRQMAIIAVDFYSRLGKIRKAKRLLIDHLRHEGSYIFLADCYLALANLEESLQMKQEYINRALTLHGMASIEIRKGATPYDCLGYLPQEKAEELKITDKKHLVTVIVPMYNAENEIATALDSLLNQTWTNLEILVVDDCSTDKSQEVVRKYQKLDSRIKLLTLKKNNGVYTARNLALKQAKGEFVTCHDSDDWSHPQKIEKQVKNLIENPHLVANVSDMARATSDLRFTRRGNPGFYIQTNISSLMFRRKEVMAKIGYWNKVRFGADTEYFSRIVRVFGKDATAIVVTALGSVLRRSGSSLTGSSVFGYHGYLNGVRKEYQEIQAYYHANAKTLKYDDKQGVLPFPVPEPMKPERRVVDSPLDMVLMADFHQEDSEEALSGFIEQARHENKTYAIVQRTNFDSWPQDVMTEGARKLIFDNRVRVLVYGEKVACKELVMYKVDETTEQKYLPEIKAETVRRIQ